MKIQLFDEHRKIKIDLRGVRQRARQAVQNQRHRGHQSYQLNILITSDREMARLHWQYLRIRGTTDVIAFGMQEGHRIAGQERVFGDIALSSETAKRMAERLGISVQEEVERYVVHGILHLLGYRDDTPRKARVMHLRQEKILNADSKD